MPRSFTYLPRDAGLDIEGIGRVDVDTDRGLISMPGKLYTEWDDRTAREVIRIVDKAFPDAHVDYSDGGWGITDDWNADVDCILRAEKRDKELKRVRVLQERLRRACYGR
ncbi:MAG: hypothetical protein WBP85_12510 [Terracidiphilus sp.]